MREEPTDGVARGEEAQLEADSLFLLEGSIPGMIIRELLVSHFLISFLTNSHSHYSFWVFGLLIGMDIRGHSFCFVGLWVCMLYF